MTFRTRKLQILAFGGNVDQFHLEPSKMLLKQELIPLVNSVLDKIFPCHFVWRQDTQRYLHTVELCLSKEVLCTKHFLICSILLTIKFSQLIELSNHQSAYFLVVCCLESVIGSIFQLVYSKSTIFLFFEIMKFC